MTARNITLALAVLLALTMALAMAVGPVALSPVEVMHALSGQGDPANLAILWEVRMPRTMAAALTGAALGLSGAALQALLRNPLAEPGTLGVSASATMAATAAVYFGLATQWPIAVPLTSLAGALATTGLIAGAAPRLPGTGSLILLGVAVSALAGAVMALFVNLAPNPFSLSDLINWTAGSVANRDWNDIAIALPFIAAGGVILLLNRANLSALVLGEAVAHSLGVRRSRVRTMVVLGCGLATAGSVALSGMVGFVGLVAPHAVRFAVRHDAGASLLPSAMAGAMLTVIADTAIRLFPWGNELHLGTLAALVGAPLFIILVFRLGRGHD